mmetsp:Transcript_15664/g.61193  ORF Transcript_15664/g.61193 Transcript_15664/m.61193 type:complete len:910 (+) Transcript_15664:73-2802(+)|eukprot:CAMPEP_0114621192 /NCGR_PEP_ID=MMETSP0168-20121206/9106_1 /TAXON_ID=95228 ORGANISM="Vannella sp., Strain DIVA3 517/6/12" /NCGR_SAMPLE_ID=MMETSP0168 /ASSEMBLY_ACC=CAM_ASM_000044 /LENGTH=909 /DNA_ID=CAMNT_0001832391 /DNA_START=73 /DNA_END=2802 /DNA_ORIENTATION=-
MSQLLPDIDVDRGLKVLVVGGCARMGGLLAQSLAKAGAALMIVDWDSCDKGRLNGLRDACRGLGANQTEVLTGKLDQEAEWTRLMDAAVNKLGGLNTLVYADALRVEGPFASVSKLVIAQQLLQANFFGPLFATNAALPHLRRTSGQVVITGNVGESAREPDTSLFTASKGAVEGFFKALQHEESSITFSVFHPGFKAENEPWDPNGVGENPKMMKAVLASVMKAIKAKTAEVAVKCQAQQTYARGRSLSLSTSNEAGATSHKVNVTVANHVVPTPSPIDPTSASPLAQAIYQQDRLQVRELLKGIKFHPEMVVETDTHGRTPLHYAAAVGNWDLGSLLIKNKKQSPLNMADDYKWTPLHVAAKNGHLVFVRKLVRAGADPNALTAGNMSAMHFVAALVPPAGLPKAAHMLELTIKSLVDVGADSNQRNVNWRTPVHVAAKRGSDVAIRALLKYEGDVHRKTKNEKETPLHCAVRGGYKQIVELLLKSGADPSAVSEAGSAFDLAKDNSAIADLCEEYRERNRRPDSDFDSTREREVIYASKLSDLPEDAMKLLSNSDLLENEALLMDNWDILLYVLRFLTRKVYKRMEEKGAQGEEQKKEDRKPKSKTMLELSLEEGNERFITSGNPRKMFKILDDAGHGGFGSVYSAKSLAEKRRIAIKRLPHMTEKEQWNNFDEIHFLSECAHSCIVKYYSTYFSRDEIWMIMEFLEGGSLGEAVSRYKLEEEHIAYVVKEILRGLRTMHSKHLVHRDLKSANIMLSITGDVKLIDFGLCADVRKEQLCNMVGSPFWIPPEMVLRQPHGCPADIWSLAILALEMANGKPPNRKSALKSMFLVGVGVTPGLDDPSKWSNEFADFLSRCLVVDPKERATASELLKHPWIKTADTKRGMKDVLHHIFIEKSLETSLGIG